MSEEIWADVVGYGGAYQVSDQGRVRSMPRLAERQGSRGNMKLKGRMLKLSIDSYGYPQVMLCASGRCANILVHHLVLEAFVGPKPTGHECRHLDGTRDNNRLSNLAWGTKAENTADRTKHQQERAAA